MSAGKSGKPPAKTDFDAVVVGAGFGGLHMMYRLRELGFTAQVVEAGEGPGGTWYWNRYPGARVDVQSIEYSFSFSKEVQNEWTWSQIMAPQEELERYVNWVTDRLDLRKHIKFNTRVKAMTWNEADSTWAVETDKGDRWVCKYVITAVGCLSAPLEPAIEGLHSFAGDSLYTNRFPKNYDFKGKRVGLVGTGSSGVQATTAIAAQAEQFYLFQRSAAFTMPVENRDWAPGEYDELRNDYDNIRALQYNSPGGSVRFGAVTTSTAVTLPTRRILDTPMEERLARLDKEGWAAIGFFAWADVMIDIEANKAAVELYGEMIRRTVKDPETAASLVPHYPMGCKRPIIDTGYFATFNRDNVTLVDLRKDPMKRITPKGIETESGLVELDTIVFATGFDAMTGSLNRIDIRGRNGARMRDAWEAEGPRTYLGLQVHGFPNLFTITGPGSPSVLTNVIMSCEQHGEWIAQCLSYMRDKNLDTIEATEDAQEDWVAHVASMAGTGTIRTHETCTSWYLGANVPGKVRVYMPYAGGLNVYRAKCNEIAAKDYEGFVLA
jgi:cation diffusion facilitator CzcD-associated flavoprotein CzcO